MWSMKLPLWVSTGKIKETGGGRNLDLPTQICFLIAPITMTYFRAQNEGETKNDPNQPHGHSLSDVLHV